MGNCFGKPFHEDTIDLLPGDHESSRSDFHRLPDSQHEPAPQPGKSTRMAPAVPPLPPMTTPEREDKDKDTSMDTAAARSHVQTPPLSTNQKSDGGKKVPPLLAIPTANTSSEGEEAGTAAHPTESSGTIGKKHTIPPLAAPPAKKPTLPPLSSLSSPAAHNTTRPGGMASLSLSGLKPQHVEDEGPTRSRVPAISELSGGSKRNTMGGRTGMGLGSLGVNLESLKRDQGDLASESARRQNKLDQFVGQINEITPYIYLGGVEVAKDKEKIASVGVTHVLNTARHVCENYFEEEGAFKYWGLYLADGASQDIESLFYDIIEFLDEATDKAHTQGTTHKAFVHCWQGVSRSTTAVIIYLMHINGWDYDKAYQFVKERRGIARPNAGFMVQLLAWHKRRTSGVSKPRLYVITPHSPEEPSLLVARAKNQGVNSRELSSGTCAVLQVPGGRLFFWKGAECEESMLAVAKRHMSRLQEFEHGGEVVEVGEGEETPEFWGYFEDKGEKFQNKGQETAEEKGEGEGGVAEPKQRRGGADPAVAEEEKGEGERGEDPEKPRLFQHPNWDELEMFDSDDLEDGVFVLFSNNTVNPSLNVVYVWVGEEEGVNNETARRMADECLDKEGIDCGNVVIVAEGSEPDEFWKLFKNG